VGRRELFTRTGRLHFVPLQHLSGVFVFRGPYVRNLVCYFPEESTAQAEGDLLQCRAQKFCVRSDHSAKVQ
jgi:hypothetical protein